MSEAPLYDAVIVGGGLAGIAAAVAVGKTGLKTLHLAPDAPADRRTSALMGPSVHYLRDAGLIDEPARLGHPLTQIRIIDATGRLLRAPETLFDCAEAGLDAFGWNFPNVSLIAAFEAARAGLPNIAVTGLALNTLSPQLGGRLLSLSDGSAISARLVIGADGKKSRVRDLGHFAVREHDFAQAALVCDLSLGRPLGGCSVEFHYAQGPFTLVPAGGDRANLVWIEEGGVLKAALAAGRDALSALLYEKSQHLFGPIALASAPHIFPLSTLSVERAGKDGIVLVGEAAHAFPPIGAQGLNLGLRDVADLGSVLSNVLGSVDAEDEDWPLRVSRDYAARRAGDLARTGDMVNALFRSLVSEMLPAQLLRSAGLWALKTLPGLRKKAFGLGMGAR